MMPRVTLNSQSKLMGDESYISDMYSIGNQSQGSFQLIGLTESQFSQLLGSIHIRQEHNISTFSGCTAKFIGVFIYSSYITNR